MSKARVGCLILISLAWAGTLLAAHGASAQTATRRPVVLSLKLNGVVDPFMASYVKRGIGQANADNDAAVLLTIDTPGGLDSSMREITQAILASKVPVICYTAPSGARAASAGTFIMLACPINVMAPGTNIGAAHPVGVSGAIENEKVTNDAAAYIVSLANRWGRNADWAAKAVRDAISAPADQAAQLHVVDYVAPDTRAALAIGPCFPSAPTLTTGALADPTFHLNLCGADVAAFHMSLAESLFHSFADPNVAFLLLNIGFLALIVWVIHPAFHVLLAVGIVSTVIGLAILETLPVRLVGVILLLIASILFVLDVKAKAHGVLTTAGIAMLVLGGLLLFNPTVPTARVSRPLIIGVAVMAALATFFMLRSILSAKDAPIRTGIETLPGSTGVTETALDPRGTVRVQHQTWTAEASGEAIPAGAPVRVVAVRGVILLVERDVAPVASAAGEAQEKGMVP